MSKAKWTFRTFSAGGYVENGTKPKPDAEEEKLLPTGIQASKDEHQKTVQANSDDDKLYPLGFGLNSYEENNQQTKQPEDEQEKLLPVGVN